MDYEIDYLLTELSLKYLQYLDVFSEQEWRPILVSNILLNSSYWSIKAELYGRGRLVWRTEICVYWLTFNTYLLDGNDRWITAIITEVLGICIHLCHLLPVTLLQSLT